MGGDSTEVSGGGTESFSGNPPLLVTGGMPNAWEIGWEGRRLSLAQRLSGTATGRGGGPAKGKRLADGTCSRWIGHCWGGKNEPPGVEARGYMSDVETATVQGSSSMGR